MTNWIDAEKERPSAGQKIIFEDAIGLYVGKFNTIKNGIVYIEGRISDIAEWENIHRWVPYPNDEE